MKAPVKVLAVDIGGTNVKILATGEKERRRFPSGLDLTPRKMVTTVKRLGRKKWQKRVEQVTERFVSVLELDDVVLGGGNAKKLTSVPAGCRVGNNAWAFLGGFRLWEKKGERS